MDAVRQLLQPITQNLPAPIAETGRTLLGPFCYKTLIIDIDPINHPDCVKLGISKALGIAIIGASSIVKIPQLLKLLNSGSAAGVSFLSYLFETSAYLISLSYNVRHGFPFSTYGETALIMIQNIAIASLVLQLSGRGWGVPLWAAALGGAGYALFNNTIVDVKTLAFLQAIAGVMGVASKAPQIFTIWQEGSTGQLSAFAIFNYLIGSLSRVFTTLQEVPDRLILYSCVAGFSLNAILAIQMLYYWNSPTTTKQTPRKKAKKVSAGASTPSQKLSAKTTGAETKGRSPSTRRRG